MKTWICRNCYRRIETENNIILTQCGCGYPMEEVEYLNKKEVKQDGKTTNNKGNKRGS